MRNILKRFLVLVMAAAMVLSGCAAAFGETADSETARIEELVTDFFEFWGNSDYDSMVELCDPKWKSNCENPQNALFNLLANRRALELYIELISENGTGSDGTVTLSVLMDRNDGKEPVQYRMSIHVIKAADGNWYIDPQSLKSYEVITSVQTEAADDTVIRNKLAVFFEGWGTNDLDRMLEVCSPEWKKEQENARRRLFELLGNRTAVDEEILNIEKTETDTVRKAMAFITVDRNDGREPIPYFVSILMKKGEDGFWYVDPESLRSPEPTLNDELAAEAAAETENDSTTEEEAPAR